MPKSLVKAFLNFPEDLQEAILRNAEIKRFHRPIPTTVTSQSYEKQGFRLYLPARIKNDEHLLIHFPGGITQHCDLKDENWCSNLADACGMMCADVNYPSSPSSTYLDIINWCLETVERLRQQDFGSYRTNERKICLIGSFLGADIAMILAVLLARKGIKVSAVLAVAPIIDTNCQDPNTAAIGLTYDRLKRDLDASFGKLDDITRNDWQVNPSRMTMEEVLLLPSTLIVLPRFDIAFQWARPFVEQFWRWNPDVQSYVPHALHMVKDMSDTFAHNQMWDCCIDHILEQMNRKEEYTEGYESD